MSVTSSKSTWPETGHLGGGGVPGDLLSGSRSRYCGENERTVSVNRPDQRLCVLGRQIDNRPNQGQLYAAE